MTSERAFQHQFPNEIYEIWLSHPGIYGIAKIVYENGIDLMIFMQQVVIRKVLIRGKARE
jgi:hypothetical protein